MYKRQGHTYGLVILGCDTPDHLFAECDDPFDWAFASFADRPLVDTQTVLTTVDLTTCRTEPAVELYACLLYTSRCGKMHVSPPFPPRKTAAARC